VTGACCKKFRNNIGITAFTAIEKNRAGCVLQNSKNNVVNVTTYRKETIMPIFETILLGKLIAAAFGKAAVGAAVKTGVAVAGKAWVAHDVVSAISHVSDAASAVDAASTAADVADTTAAFTSVAGPVGDCGGILPVDITTTLPTDIPTTPDGVIIDCGTGITPDGTATAATFTTDGVDA
jgi:hypothetical protein